MQVQVSRTRVAERDRERQREREREGRCSARRSCTRCTRRLAVARQVKTGLLGKLYQVGSCYPWRDLELESSSVSRPSHRAKILRNVTRIRQPLPPNRPAHIPETRTRAVCECMARAPESRFTRIIMGRVWHRCQNGESCGTSLNSRRTCRSTSHESGSIHVII